MKRIAVVLSGCGFLDGTEITEAISTLIALSSHADVEYQCFAPTTESQATDHLTKETGKTRNTLNEAARISRGDIKPVEELNEKDFDAVIFPGGYGAALHLSTWATKGAQCEVHSHVEKIIKDFHRESKPIGAICIAPTLVAKVLGSEGVTLTIGTDADTATEIEKTGAHHEKCRVDDYITDRQRKVVTTPAYMYDDAKPAEVFRGITGLVNEIVEMA